MNQDSNKLLERLRSRRHGVDRLGAISLDHAQDALSKQLLGESYEKRAGGQPYTRYALGAMQEVDSDYTRISKETADRVQNQLAKRLASNGIATEFRHQGSVPLNVHIRGVSDIDLLVIESGTLFYARDGARAQRQGYAPAVRPGLSVLADLRSQSEAALRVAFTAADVDTSGPKAIKIAGGSLARPVDVVPALWWDTAAYQLSGAAHDRGVSIYHRDDHATIENLPFLHIKRITDRCDATLGGLRRAIRLCKNIKADAEEDGTKISLSSYDIAGLMYHADDSALRKGIYWDLAILAETQRHLNWLLVNPDRARALVTPDGSRPILDAQGKLEELRKLSDEMDKLLAQVAGEQNALLKYAPTMERSRSAVRELIIQ